MLLPQQYGCDTSGCMEVRTATNHWQVVTKDATGIHVRTWDQADARGCLADSSTSHHCGQSHALQQVSNLMGEDYDRGTETAN